MAKAAADADIIIESVAENVKDKIAFYEALSPFMPAKTILCTNSSTLLPSTFANDIRMVALPVNKEKNGYLLNSMLVPFLLSGLDLYVNGVSAPASIDKAWKYGTGAPRGPFEIFDVVGINTARNSVLQKMIDDGRLGRSSGEGFYKYSV